MDKIALRKAQLEYYIERDSRYIKSLTQQLKENQSILRVLNKGGISPDCNKSSTIMGTRWRIGLPCGRLEGLRPLLSFF